MPPPFEVNDHDSQSVTVHLYAMVLNQAIAAHPHHSSVIVPHVLRP
jgi:hypothetical protein